MNIFKKFFDWYERHYRAALLLTTLLFLLQIFHLYWLFTDIILGRLTGRSYFLLEPVWGQISIIFDYSEIPALISTTILYIHQLRQRYSNKTLVYLVFLNIQWLHLFWITDHFVITRFSEEGSLFRWANTLAWIAILIDYLELPVIFDTVKDSVKEVKKYFSEPTA